MFCALLLFLYPRLGASAQSITGASITGVVRDSGGRFLRAALVTLTERATGFSRSVDVDAAGRFGFWLIPRGEYDGLIEAFGFRPTRVVGIRVDPANSTRLDVQLRPAVAPVDQALNVVSPARGGGVSASGVSRLASGLELNAAPAEPFSLSDADQYIPSSGWPGSVEGLPRNGTRPVVDGLPWQVARNPWLSEDPGAGIASWALDAVELVTNDIDVEWSGFGGAQLVASSRRGAQPASVQAFGDWSGKLLARSAQFGGPTPPFASWRAGMVLGAPIIRDTAQVQVGFERESRQTPVPRTWLNPGLELALGPVVRDTFGASVDEYMRPHSTRVTRMRPFGKLDWNVGAAHSLGVLAAADVTTADEPELGQEHGPAIGARMEANSYLAGLVLGSVLGPKIWNEMRVAVTGSGREYTPAPLPGTRVVEFGALFGTDPAATGRFRRTGVTFSDAATLTFGEHRVKVGLAAELAAHDYTFAYRRGGEFTVSGPADLAARRGVFVQSVSVAPASRFSTGGLALFLQDVWTVAPGLDLQFGVRYENEYLPGRRVALDQDWFTQTGLDNSIVPTRLTKLSPRAGFNWRIGRDGSWVLRGRSGVFHDNVDPVVLHELISTSGRIETRRGVGNLGRWPALPDSTAAPVSGRQLSLLGPNFESPRTSRASIGLSWLPNPGAAIHAAASVRRTTFLVRRHDLNRLTGVAGRDQHGRPLYGTLVQLATILVAQPGTNRRFTGYDLVSALDPEGASDYWDLTIGAERRLGTGFRLAAWYTYSHARDNWLPGRSGGPEGQLTPFPDSLSGRDWADGPSDFDVPHSIGMVTELSPLRSGSVALSARYWYRSGHAFTPGFRNGVDANGDGSAGNDPAFVDDGLPGMPELLAAQPCLQPFVGQFVDRNACREPGEHRLDLRLAIRPLRAGPFAVTVIADALNVLDGVSPVRDRAVYTVDGSGTLVTNPATGVVTVPFVVNPLFGEPLERRRVGRLFRVGLRVN